MRFTNGHTYGSASLFLSDKITENGGKITLNRII